MRRRPVATGTPILFKHCDSQPLVRKSPEPPDCTPINGGKLFQALDAMEQEADLTAQIGQSRWMIPYADLLTLLLGLFLALFITLPATQKAPIPHPLPIKSAATASLSPATPSISPASRQLEERLRHMSPIPGMEIRRQEQGVVLSLKESVLFSPGDAALNAPASRTLDRLASRLTEVLGNAPGPIRIEGHTDNTPIATSRYPSNWELSTARATNIVRYLIEARHFPPAQISAAGYGEFRPLENNSSIEGKRKNRRVDIVILNSGVAREEPHGQTH